MNLSADTCCSKVQHVLARPDVRTNGAKHGPTAALPFQKKKGTILDRPRDDPERPTCEHVTLSMVIMLSRLQSLMGGGSLVVCSA